DHALRALDVGSPMKDSLVEVHEAARRAGQLAHQMLAYSGQVGVAARPTDLSAMIRDLETPLRAAAAPSAMTMELADALPWVVGDAGQLQQVLISVVTNAAEAM